MKKIVASVLLIFSFSIYAEDSNFKVCESKESKCVGIATEVQQFGNAHVKTECREVLYSTPIDKATVTLYHECKVTIKGVKEPYIFRHGEAKPWAVAKHFKQP